MNKKAYTIIALLCLLILALGCTEMSKEELKVDLMPQPIINNYIQVDMNSLKQPIHENNNVAILEVEYNPKTGEVTNVTCTSQNEKNPLNGLCNEIIMNRIDFWDEYKGVE